MKHTKKTRTGKPTKGKPRKRCKRTNKLRRPAMKARYRTRKPMQGKQRYRTGQRLKGKQDPHTRKTLKDNSKPLKAKPRPRNRKRFKNNPRDDRHKKTRKARQAKVCRGPAKVKKNKLPIHKSQPSTAKVNMRKPQARACRLLTVRIPYAPHYWGVPNRKKPGEFSPEFERKSEDLIIQQKKGENLRKFYRRVVRGYLIMQGPLIKAEDLAKLIAQDQDIPFEVINPVVQEVFFPILKDEDLG